MYCQLIQNILYNQVISVTICSTFTIFLFIIPHYLLKLRFIFFKLSYKVKILQLKLLQKQESSSGSQYKMQNPITLEQQRKVWTIHQSVNGITYYYNRSTKKSQYEMPQCFKITEEDLDHPDWKQYRTAEGKKFYYNALTRKSCWHMPAQVKQWKIKIQDQKRAERQKNGNKQQQPLSEADQIKKKLMALFKNKMINVNTKWDVCIKLCEDDDRWNLLKTSDKKRFFTEYISELKKISQLQLKAKTQANRIQFIKMLKQHKNLTSDCKMHRVQFDFITDPRWRILDGVDKQNAFQDYMDQLLHKQKQAARIDKQRNIESLKSLLQEKQVRYDMKWDEFRNQFKDYDCYKKLHELDRINTFTKYIIEAEQRNQQKQKKQKRMKERTDRTQFRNLIKSKLYNGQINYKTKWRAFIKEFKDDERLLNMMDPEHKGSSAHQIFENLMEGIRRNHKTFKSQIKTHFKKIVFRMTQQTTFYQFKQKLSDLPLYAQAKDFYQQYFYHYFRQKIKSKNAAKQEKQKQKQKQKLAALKRSQKKEKKTIFKIFKQYSQNAKSKYGINDHIQKIEQNLSEQGISISRQNIFKYYLGYLAQADGEQDKKSRQSQKSEKMKSRSRSSSSSRSRSKSQRKRKRRRQDEREKSRQKDRDRDYQREKEKDSNKKQIKIIKQNVVVKPITIPNELRQMVNNNQIEQEGQIKDDEIIEASIVKKSSEKPKQIQISIQKDRKRKKSSKKKKGSSSSDSN